MRPALKSISLSIPSSIKASIQFTATALALSVAAIGQANAAGFALMEQNASGLGNAYAGQAAAAEDASTIFFNPAGMTQIKGRQLVGALHAIYTTGEFNDNGSTGPAGPLHPLGGDGGDPGDLSGVPNGYLSWEVVPNQLWLGIGVNAPFGLKTEYDDDWVGRFHGTKSEVMSINVNPSIAWKANETVSFGGGLNLQYFKADLSSQVSYTAASGGLIPFAEGESNVEGDDWSWGWNFGVMFNFSPSTRLGLHYRSRIDYELEGDADFDDVPPVGALPLVFADGDITADLEVPASFSIGLSHYFTPRLQLLADYTWTDWDSIETLRIMRTSGSQLTALPLNFEDSWRAGIGLNYQLNDYWKLRFGVAYDESPVQDEFRTPRLPDEDRVWTAIGAQWKFSPNGALDFGYAYIWVDEAELDLDSVDPSVSPLPRGNLVGDYDANVHIFSMQMRYSF